jgi:hypothetical protein
MISRSWQPPEGAQCAKCGERPPGSGGILCPPCKTAIEARIYQQQDPANDRHDPPQ